MKLRTYTIQKWADIFGIEIIDNDGFRGLELNKHEVNLELFVDGIISCTINPVNHDKYKVLEMLW